MSPRSDRFTPVGIEVGERIARAIEEGFTQRSFAERLGVSEGVLSIWIAGGIPAAWERFRKLCVTAGVSADELLGLPADVAEHEVRERSDGEYEAPVVEEIRRAIREELRGVRRRRRRL